MIPHLAYSLLGFVDIVGSSPQHVRRQKCAFFLDELEFHGLSRVLVHQTGNVRRKLSIPNDHLFGWKNSTVPGTSDFRGGFAVQSY